MPPTVRNAAVNHQPPEIVLRCHVWAAAAVAITAAAKAAATTTGNSAGAHGGKKDATTVGSYNKGMATFTIAKGGLMYQATIGGQKFSYTAR